MRNGILTFLLVLFWGVCPQGSLGQTCSPTVEVPAFMTIKVGETKDWNVEFGNDGPDTAEVVWTLTPGGCDKKLKAEPKTGKAVLPDGGRKTDTVSVTAESNVCARNDADFPVVAVACKTSANDSGKICILPTGEHSVYTRKDVTFVGDYAYFWGYVEPSTADFSGREVKEVRLSVNDPCYRGGVPGIVDFEANSFFLNSSTWTLGNQNQYDHEDRIGGGDLFPQKSRKACTVTAQQSMQILCSDGSWYEYKVNPVEIIFAAGSGNAIVKRDTASSQ